MTRQIDLKSAIDIYNDDHFVTLAPLQLDSWVVATIVPASDFLGDDRGGHALLLEAALR